MVSQLKLLKTKLTANGVVICSIPNVRYYKVLRDLVFKRDLVYAESGILDYTHFRFFTKKSMQRMFQECGFDIVSCEGINKSKSVSPLFLKILTLGAFDSEVSYLQFASVLKVL